MERPSVANVDMLMLVIASVPQPDMLLCDKLILRAEKGGMIPAICVNKIDLGDDLAEQIRREYVLSLIHISGRKASFAERRIPGRPCADIGKRPAPAPRRAFAKGESGPEKSRRKYPVRRAA